MASSATRGHPFVVVGIGASAGGLEAFGQLLRNLPTDTGFAFVLVQHLDPTHASMLSTLLSRTSPMPVHEAKDGVAFGPDCVYVIPPNTFLAIDDGALRLSPRPEARGAPMPIDYFLRSLAENLGSMAIGVVLSGTGSDGAAGLAEIKARGGLTFAQDEQSATYPGMPRAAAHASAVDFVLPPADIARELVRISHAPATLRGDAAEESPGPADGGDLRRVLAMMKQATGADLSYYKSPTLLRRIARRILLLDVAGLAEYVQHLQHHPAELTALHNDILINVTSFFRDPEMVEGLAEHVFPALVGDRRVNETIRIWVPGCASGEEAYSIAIALLEYCGNANVNFPIQIFATDLSEPALARARAGIYVDEMGVSPERLARFFVKTDHGHQVSKSVRDLCIFAKHNLLQDPPYSQLDVVSCRNVLIYLRPEFQRRVFELLHFALKPSGFLMLGRSETITGSAELFGLVDKRTRVYAKKPTPKRSLRFAPELEVASGIGRREAVLDPSRRLDDIIRRADVALSRHTPPAVVIDDDAEILHFRGDTKPYLGPSPGPTTSNLFRMARPPLQLDLRAAMDAVRRENAPVGRGPVVFDEDGRVRRVSFEVTPLPVREGDGRHFVVLFVEEPEQGADEPEGHTRPPIEARGTDEEATVLRRELAESRLHLEGIIQELESLNEEYRSAHEEALSSNEELQSTNEELETAKEELQSGNEELTTVNDELQSRSAELGQINNDLVNVLSSVDMPVVLVGPDLRLRRFTAMATQVLNVIATDVGRPIGDLTLNVPVPDLGALALETMATMQPRERDIQDRQGRWYSMRVRPYRTHDHRIDGAVIMLVDIDDRRRAMMTAEQAQRYAEAIVTTVREPLLVLDDRLTVVAANRGFYGTFGVAPDVTLGRRLYELGDRQWNIPRLRELLEEVIPQHKAFDDFEVMTDFPGVGPRTMLLNARRVEDLDGSPQRILLAIEDITARRAAELEREELLAATERARTEAEGVGDLLRHVQAIADTALLKLSFDDLLQALVTRVRDTLGGDTAVILLRTRETGDDERSEDVLHARAAVGLEEEVRQRIRVPIGRGFAGRVASERQPVVLDDVDYSTVVSPYIREKGLRSLVGVPLLTEGGLLGVLHVGSVAPGRFGRRHVQILTLAAERIAHAVEVAARREGERSARAAAEAANRAKDEFLALLSHELRNPLSAIRNSVIAARRDSSNKDRALEIAIRQSDHLARLVDDLLDVARITQGKIRLRQERIRLRDAAARAIESTRSAVEARGHTLSLVCPDDGTVAADPVRVEQIIENLVTNAAKYTPPGGRIDVEIEHRGSEATLRVRDNGMGIPAELLPRVFDLFSQGDIRLDRAQGGLGIGLTVVRRLVELHGGKIEAHSEGAGRGAEFVVRLPGLPAVDEANPVEHRRRTASSARVLVVEDNRDAAEALKMMLELSGHRVRVTHDGEAALSAVEAESPDIVLLDIGLPVMDGYELARRLRELPTMARAILVAISGYGRDEDKERAHRAGFHVHVTKPVDPDRLEALMADLWTPAPEN